MAYWPLNCSRWLDRELCLATPSAKLFWIIHCSALAFSLHWPSKQAFWTSTSRVIQGLPRKTFLCYRNCHPGFSIAFQGSLISIIDTVIQGYSGLFTEVFSLVWTASSGAFQGSLLFIVDSVIQGYPGPFREALSLVWTPSSIVFQGLSGKLCFYYGHRHPGRFLAFKGVLIYIMASIIQVESEPSKEA